MCLVDKFVKFRQGGVWQEIKAEFEASGMRPTAPDRERLSSGIELSEHLAKAVREAQSVILNRHKDKLREVEGKFFEDMRAQKKLEQVRGAGGGRAVHAGGWGRAGGGGGGWRVILGFRVGGGGAPDELYPDLGRGMHGCARFGPLKGSVPAG